MKTILCTFAAIAALSVPFASQSLAAPHAGKSSHSSSSSRSSKTGSSNRAATTNVRQNRSGRYSNYNLTHGTKFAHGYFYRGREHSHWSSHRYDSRYGCECYFDPSCSSWYYWCQPDSCYYPVSYCPYRVYGWSPSAAVSAPCETCSSVTVPVNVQTITRTTFLTTTVRNQSAVAESGGVGPQEGGPVPNSLPPIPAPVGRQ